MKQALLIGLEHQETALKVSRRNSLEQEPRVKISDKIGRMFHYLFLSFFID